MTFLQVDFAAAWQSDREWTKAVYSEGPKWS